MTPNDAVNEGLLADECWHDLIEKDDRNSPEEYPDHALISKDELAAYICRALRAVPSPDTVGVLEALEPFLAVIRVMDFYTAEAMPEMIFPKPEFQTRFPDEPRCVTLTQSDFRRLAALSPSHCTAGRREEIARALKTVDWSGVSIGNKAIIQAAILALTSEQSGP